MSQNLVSTFQPSLTEWFAVIDPAQSTVVRDEDNRKMDRLEVLFKEIGVPYERAEVLPARDFWDQTPAFQKMMDERGDKLCGLGLVPTRSELPKLRNRGL